MQAIRHLVTDKPVLAVEAGMTVLEAARYMSEHVIGAVPVLENGALVGMFTERDLMTRVVVARRDLESTRVREVMTSEVVAAGPEERYSDCIAKMSRVHCRHLPVIENGRLIGTISLRDLLRQDIKERETEIRLLTEYVQYLPPGVDGPGG